MMNDEGVSVVTDESIIGNNNLATFSYIRLEQIATESSPRREIRWPGLLLHRDASPEHVAAFPEHIERRIIGVDVRKLFKELVMLLAKENKATGNGTDVAVPAGYDIERCKRYGAIYLFGNPVTQWNIGRFDPTKIICNETEVPLEQAVDEFRDINGYVQACEEAEWYLRASDEDGPGPLSRREAEAEHQLEEQESGGNGKDAKRKRGITKNQKKDFHKQGRASGHGSDWDSSPQGNTNSKYRQTKRRRQQHKNQEQNDDDDASSDETSVADEVSSIEAEEIRNVGKPLSKPRTKDCVSSFGWSDHPGTKLFWGTIRKFGKKYYEASREERPLIINKIMTKFGAHGGRFLRPIKEGAKTLWVDLTRNSVREKIGKALLDCDFGADNGEGSSDEGSNDESSVDEISVIDEYTDKDCICIQNSKWRNHPGNKKFNSIVARYHSEYIQAKKRAGTVGVGEKVEQEFRRYGGRFLRPSEGSESGSWTELTHAQVRKKISNILRRYPGVTHANCDTIDDDDDDDDNVSSSNDCDSQRKSDSDDGGSSGTDYVEESGKTKPKDLDCVLGFDKGSRTIGRKGQRNYENIIRDHCRRYRVALDKIDTQERRRLRTSVFKKFRRTGGRFIRKENGSWILVNRKVINDKIRQSLVREAQKPSCEQSKSSENGKGNASSSNDSLDSDDDADLPLFKRLRRDGDGDFFYKSFRYSHLEQIPTFDDVRESLEKAGHVFSEGEFSMPNGNKYPSEVEYRKKMCDSGVPVRGLRPRICHEDPDFQIVMAWVCYVRLEELNHNMKDVTTMEMDTVGDILSKVEGLDDERKYFTGLESVEKLSRKGVPLEAVEEFKLSRLEHMQLERYFSCPYSRSLVDPFFYRA
jgi:hypothetical protein